MRKKKDEINLIEALNILEQEKGISKEVVMEAIETSLLTVTKKNFDLNEESRVAIDSVTGKIQLFVKKEVVEEVFDENIEISLEDAQERNPIYEIGDIIEEEIVPKNFDRITAQTAKQVITQKLRSEERNILYEKFVNMEKELITGTIKRFDRRNVILTINGMEATLLQQEQILNEKYTINDRLKVYITEIKQTPKGINAFVSRKDPKFVVRLFEEKVTEIHDGIVEIKSVSREAGQRTKIAITSNDENVDAISACIGERGVKINSIIEELNGEKIDLIYWNEDVRQFVAASLSPCKVLGVEICEDENIAKVVVPDDQLSLAIGKEGQNVRLAVKLANSKIDIKSESVAKETSFIKPESYFELEQHKEEILEDFLSE